MPKRSLASRCTMMRIFLCESLPRFFYLVSNLREYAFGQGNSCRSELGPGSRWSSVSSTRPAGRFGTRPSRSFVLCVSVTFNACSGRSSTNVHLARHIEGERCCNARLSRGWFGLPASAGASSDYHGVSLEGEGVAVVRARRRPLCDVMKPPLDHHSVVQYGKVGHESTRR